MSENNLSVPKTEYSLCKANVTAATPRQLFNPLATPSWRYERVLELGSAQQRPTPRDDEHVREAYEYFRKRLSAKTTDTLASLQNDFLELDLAHQLYQDVESQVPMKTIIEARLLSGQSYEEIADRMRTLPQVVERYHAMFFDVQDCLENSDWIARHVFVQTVEKCIRTLADEAHPDERAYLDYVLVDEDFEESRNKQTKVKDLQRRHDEATVSAMCDMSIKLLGYYGGPFVCDNAITGLTRDSRTFPTDPEAIGEWLQNRFKHIVQQRTLQTLMKTPVSRYNERSYLGMTTKIAEITAMTQGSEGQQTADQKRLVSGVRALFGSLPLCFGGQGGDIYNTTSIGAIDDSPRELRSKDLMRLSARQSIDASATEVAGRYAAYQEKE